SESQPQPSALARSVGRERIDEGSRLATVAENATRILYVEVSIRTERHSGRRAQASTASADERTQARTVVAKHLVSALLGDVQAPVGAKGYPGRRPKPADDAPQKAP